MFETIPIAVLIPAGAAALRHLIRGELALAFATPLTTIFLGTLMIRALQHFNY